MRNERIEYLEPEEDNWEDVRSSIYNIFNEVFIDTNLPIHLYDSFPQILVEELKKKYNISLK